MGSCQPGLSLNCLRNALLTTGTQVLPGQGLRRFHPGLWKGHCGKGHPGRSPCQCRGEASKSCRPGRSSSASCSPSHSALLTGFAMSRLSCCHSTFYLAHGPGLGELRQGGTRRDDPVSTLAGCRPHIARPSSHTFLPGPLAASLSLTPGDEETEAGKTEALSQQGLLKPFM